MFQTACRAAQRALDARFAALPIETIGGSLGSRASRFHPDLIANIAAADDGRNVERHSFEIALVTSGPAEGLRAVGVGSSQLKRTRALHVALALTAVYAKRPDTAIRPDVGGSLEKLLDALLIPSGVANMLIQVSGTSVEEWRRRDREEQPSANSDNQPQAEMFCQGFGEDLAGSCDRAPQNNASAVLEKSDSSDDDEVRSVLGSEFGHIRQLREVVAVDNIWYSQRSISSTFRDGRLFPDLRPAS